MSALPKTDKFPLLLLPFLAIQEVFSTWTPFDLIHFSLISSKSKMIVKSVTRASKHKNRYSICSRMDEYPDLRITESDIDTEFLYEFLYAMTPHESQNERFFNSSEKHQAITKHSKDVLEGYKEWVDFVLDVLNCEIHEIQFHPDAFPDKNLEIIDWWKSKSNSTNSCEVLEDYESDDCKDVTVSYLLENLKMSEHLFLESQLSDNFQATIPKVSNRLDIDHGKWVTLQQLLECVCPSISIVYSGLTNQEVNQFLKAWQSSESNFNLTYFHIEVQNEVVLEESLNIQTVDDNVQMTRIDGKVAELTIDDGLLRIRIKQR